MERVTVTVPPGTTLPLHTVGGNRAITGIRAQVELPAPPEDRRALRELALSIRWDGEGQPSVWSPLGDFFGAAPGVCFYRTLPLGVTDGGLYCHWFMPFAERAELARFGETLLAKSERLPSHQRALAVSATGLMLVVSGDRDRARPLLEQSLPLFREGPGPG